MSYTCQGIVQETLNLSELAGYQVGGTIHIIVNNQVGFTTPPESSRSYTYSSDVAKMLQIPIFHVNGENPEAVAQVIQKTRLREEWPRREHWVPKEARERRAPKRLQWREEH